MYERSCYPRRNIKPDFSEVYAEQRRSRDMSVRSDLPEERTKEQNGKESRGVSTWKYAIGIVVALVIIGLVVAIVYISLNQPAKVAPSTATTYTTSEEPIPDKERLECVANQDKESDCVKAGCLWYPSNVYKASDAPKCVLPKETAFGYHVVEYDSDRPSLLLSVGKGSFFGSDFKKVRLNIFELSDNVLRLQFVDEEVERYQVPIHVNTTIQNATATAQRVYDIDFQTDPEKFFSFKVSRKDDKTVIFDSSVGSLFLAEKHIELTTKLPSKHVYGIGENTHTTFMHDLNFKKWPLFSRDQAPDPDDPGRYNLYGVHPYYMCLEDSGKSHGVLFLNSNAMEFTLTPMPALNFRSSGGILDMFFFLGDNPEHTTMLYTEVVGRPVIPPYWATGFHLSRYGFNSLDNMTAALDRTRRKGFPVDVLHGDIDIMNERKDFTWDSNRFPDFNKFIDKEKNENGLRFVIIVDPAVLANDSSYTVYRDGEDGDVYIKWPAYIPQEKRGYPTTPGLNLNKNIMFGSVWPKGPVAFPDFFKNATMSWWENTIRDYRSKLNFDGIWIDMNEPSNFGTNQERRWDCPDSEKKCWSLKCPENKYDNPKDTFVPAAVSVYSPGNTLADRTLCMAAIQGERGEYVHYDVHSLYGWSESVATYNALKATAKADQAPFVLSRSTYPSSGRYATHWLGDNLSTWFSMRTSIIGMLEFNLFGMPFIGADICGFNENSNSELCGRWLQLGAFYPFCRSHNGIHSIDQDPGSDIMNESDRERARVAMKTRYQLLPYLHTLLYFANTRGSSVVRPLFHEFPTDRLTYGIQEQFLWGPSLLISPVLYESATELTLYLPNDTWFDFYEGTIVKLANSDRTLKLTNLEVVPLHVRGGTVLPLKEPGANNTRHSRQLKFEIRVYPKNGSAEGNLFWTAEEATDLENPKFYRLYRFQLKENTLLISLHNNGSLDSSNKQVIGKILVHDMNGKPNNVSYQDQVLDLTDYSYNSTNKVLTIQHLIELHGMTTNDETGRRRTVKWA